VIFTQNRDNYDNGEYNQNKNTIGSVIFKAFKWFIYAIGLLIIGIVIYRFISTATPSELKNYIIKSDTIEKAYSESVSAKEEFKIYRLEMRNPFSLGDALFVLNPYYLENAENLQLTLRCKNSEVQNLIGSYNYDDDNTSKFYYYLKITDTTPINETKTESETSETEVKAIPNYRFIEPVNSSSFGEAADRYKYFTVSFDGVKIDYANTKVEFYVFVSRYDGNTVYDEANYLARFTIFDINMPKTKLNAKNFKIDQK